MRKLISISTLLLFCFFLSLQAFSQGCEEPASDDGDDEKKIKIIGFIQPQYEFHMTKDEDAIPVAENSNTFKFKRARIGVTGAIPYDFSYYVMVETSPYVSPTGYPYLLDAFISYRRFEWAKISVGSFKQPFGLEVNTPCSGLHSIERAMASDQLVVPQRDIGIMLFGGGKDKLLSYSVAVMNGKGIGKKDVDNNQKKDLIGRVVFHPLDWLNIGGSFRYGHPLTDSVSRTSFAGEIEIKYSGLRVQAEYIYDEGDYDASASGGCGGTPMTLGDKRSGFWAMAMYKFRFNLEPVVKIETFSTGNTNEEEFLITTFGVNYFFNDNIRIQANYQYRAEYNSNSNAEFPNDAILLQLQAKF